MSPAGSGETSEPKLVLVRHGATEWSENGRHTGRTDLPLLPKGRARAGELGRIFAGVAIDRVLCSPMRRARETCELAGFGDRMVIVDDLHEWDYGEYEGLTSPEIRERNPEWDLWRDGCPGGESPAQVAARADRVIGMGVAPSAAADTICFAHGHILRVLSARWCGFAAAGGERLALAPAGIAKLGHEHATRVIDRWNVTLL